MREYFYLILILFFCSSCGAYKQVPYFTDLKADSDTEEAVKNYQAVRIQKDDILAITVNSLNSDASAIFNMGNINPSVTQSLGSSTAVNGFLVDQDGNIQLPLVGAIKVAGLSTSEARLLVHSKVLNYLKEPVVSLRLANFRVSVLGDVARPGVFPIPQERLSVAEALSLAGDLNITALRKNVLLVREEDGKRKFIRLDLNSKSLFDSPYYYLKSNDIIYVQPSNAKYASVDRNYRNLGLGLSVVSILIVILTRL